MSQFTPPKDFFFKHIPSDPIGLISVVDNEALQLEHENFSPARDFYDQKAILAHLKNIYFYETQIKFSSIFRHFAMNELKTVLRRINPAHPQGN
jgi:hypothetical protein